MGAWQAKSRRGLTVPGISGRIEARPCDVILVESPRFLATIDEKIRFSIGT
jgi:hypothetical protein